MKCTLLLKESSILILKYVLFTKGSYAMVSLLSGNVIDKMVLKNDTNLTAQDLENAYRVSVGTSLALLVGIINLIMGIGGLGFISTYFSDTFISSYTCGSAIHVCISQIKDLFGIKGTAKFEGPLKIPYVC